MSSLRNSLHRRNHKERSQLASREKLGTLEKHKDYVLRARDYHSKQQRLQRLRERAASRNKDEFYFGMNKERTVGGVHVQTRGNRALPVDIVKALKTQDENYLRTKRSRDLKKIDLLRTQLSAQAVSVKLQEEIREELDEEDIELLSAESFFSANVRTQDATGAKRAHIVFVEGNEPVHHKEKTKATEVGQVAVDLGWDDVQVEVAEGQADSGCRGVRGDSDVRELVATRLEMLRELAARLKRERLLRYACRELEMQRLLMAKGGRKKLRGVEPKDDEKDEADEEGDGHRVSSWRSGDPVGEREYRPREYKWRLERKR